MRSSSPRFCFLRWCREGLFREGKSKVGLRTALKGEPAMIRQLSRFAISAVLVVGLQGCGDKKPEASEQSVRGLRAYKVAAKAESRVRRFPSVLQPADVS